jgi:hypothetical protein
VPERLPFSSDYHPPATPTLQRILQRLPFSSASHSPAPTILQRLPFSSACRSPASPNLQRLPLSSAYRSPAPPILQRLPISSAYRSPAPPILQRLLFSTPLGPHFLAAFQGQQHSHFVPWESSLLAPSFLWPLYFSGYYLSLATTFLWTLHFLQPLHFSGHYFSPAPTFPTFLWPLRFSSSTPRPACLSHDIAARDLLTVLKGRCVVRSQCPLL